VIIALLISLVAVTGAMGTVLWYRRLVVRRVDELADRLGRTAASRSGTLENALERLERSVGRTEDAVAGEASSRNLVHAALERLPTGVIVVDQDGREVFRNTWVEASGATQLNDTLVLDAVADMLASARAGVAQRRILELFGPPRRTVSIHTIGLGDAGGAVALIEDVTERLRLEAVRSDFVANISHELRTPVGALAVLAETLEGEGDPETVDRLSHRLQNEAHRVGRLIDDLLELTRIEGSELRSQERLVATDLVLEAVERLRPLARERNVSVEMHEPPERLLFVGDRRQVASALGNLVQNAVRYSEADSIVEIWTGRNGEQVEFKVVDHGIGIPSNQLDRIFERFYRVDRARTRETGGTGLGLSIVRHVVDNHRGSISVESVEGVGSTFTMRLPLGIIGHPVALQEAG
jgi:two-component system sensor histidine kinase SenX3